MSMRLLWMVWLTQGSVGVDPPDTVDVLETSALWGLARSARSENPELRLNLVDVLDLATEIEPVKYALSINGEPEIAIRTGEGVG